MKKILLSLLTIVIAFAVTAQQVPRDMVVVEILTDAVG